MSDDQIIWKLEPFPEPYEEERRKARDEIYNYFISAQLPSNKAAISAPCSKSTLKTEIAQEYQRITGCSKAAHHYMDLIFDRAQTYHADSLTERQRRFIEDEELMVSQLADSLVSDLLFTAT
ncbi:hypothetical protein RJZ56_005430 [Blastomyces dermatitidis]